MVSLNPGWGRGGEGVGRKSEGSPQTTEVNSCPVHYQPRENFTSGNLPRVGISAVQILTHHPNSLTNPSPQEVIKNTPSSSRLHCWWICGVIRVTHVCRTFDHIWSSFDCPSNPVRWVFMAFFPDGKNWGSEKLCITQPVNGGART